MNHLLAFAAALEALTGLAMIATPALVAGLLIGSELSAAALNVIRFGGIGLLSLGIAAWPRTSELFDSRGARRAMLAYNALAAIFLGYLAIRGEWSGILLWPAAALHAVLTALLLRASIMTPEGARV